MVLFNNLANNHIGWNKNLGKCILVSKVPISNFIIQYKLYEKNILKCYVKWICFSIYSFVMILFYFINTNYLKKYIKMLC